MYGVPRYNDVDPTLLVAISYTLLFGIMFGDLGQGIILSLVGLVAEKKFNLKLGGVGVSFRYFQCNLRYILWFIFWK